MEPEIPQQDVETKSTEGRSGRARLFLIDSMSYIFRAYHALPRLTNRKGLSTHAVYGFNNILRKMLATYNPEYVGAVFDLAGPTFRHESFAEYKANREEMPEDLAEQLPYIRQLLEAVRIPVLSHPGFEADDVIGTLAGKAAAHNLDVFIISSDKDMMQLVGDHVFVINPMKDDQLYDARKVAEVVGIAPSQVPDLMALQGDAIDNIPGAPGIGPKGALELIQIYGRVEACLEHAAEVKKKTYREALLNYRDQILLSKQLATIDTNAPVELSMEEVLRREPDRDKLQQLYQEMDFTSLLRELLPEAAAGSGNYQELRGEAGEALLRKFLEEHVNDERPVALAVRPPSRKSKGAGSHNMELSLESGESQEETDKPTQEGFGEVALSAEPGQAVVAPASMLPLLKPWLEDPNSLKVAHDLKAAILELQSLGSGLNGALHDTMLYSFLLDANENSHSLESVVERRFSTKPSGALGEQADWAGRLLPILEPEVRSQNLGRVYSEIELPLAPILAGMETRGVKLDPAPLVKLSALLEKEMGNLCQEIYRLTGSEFNINSPKQLGEVLFEKMGLPAPRKRGKSKAVSTAVDVLEELAVAHEAPRKVLEYRQMAKLKSTYIDSLPRLIDPATGRLHTHYNQAGAATGRLSSINPNLQNIPIRTELGREIRAAFVAEEGFRLVAADYSQIELRLLAHLSQDPLLLEAFRRGDDIHELTAAAVFGVPPQDQTPEHRRRAKAVNYGIVYGLSAFGLSQQLSIPQAQAQEYITEYFNRYQGVKKFIDTTLEEARRTSEVRTFFGRRRKIPEINSKNWTLRQFAERTAKNSPLQGGAADLIKLAMIAIHSVLLKAKFAARMILQVHDEVILEVPEEEVEQAASVVRERMEMAYHFRVPLVADVSAGLNWRDMEEIPR